LSTVSVVQSLMRSLPAAGRERGERTRPTPMELVTGPR
jgi:hypothetical protein